LIPYSGEVIVENGGDIFLQTARAATVAVFAGASPLSLRIGIRTAVKRPAGRVHLRRHRGALAQLRPADAVCVVSRSCALADAAATAIGNRIQSKQDIPAGIEIGKRIPGVIGLVIVAADQMGVWGAIEVVALDRKKG